MTMCPTMQPPRCPHQISDYQHLTQNISKYNLLGAEGGVSCFCLVSPSQDFSNFGINGNTRLIVKLAYVSLSSLITPISPFWVTCPHPSPSQLLEDVFLSIWESRSGNRRHMHKIARVTSFRPPSLPAGSDITSFLSAFFTLPSQNSQINDHRPILRMSDPSIAIKGLA